MIFHFHSIRCFAKRVVRLYIPKHWRRLHSRTCTGKPPPPLKFCNLDANVVIFSNVGQVNGDDISHNCCLWPRGCCCSGGGGGGVICPVRTCLVYYQFSPIFGQCKITTVIKVINGFCFTFAYREKEDICPSHNPIYQENHHQEQSNNTRNR